METVNIMRRNYKKTLSHEKKNINEKLIQKDERLEKPTGGTHYIVHNGFIITVD